MSLVLYKPTKSNKGCLFNVSFTARPEKGDVKGDKSFYIKLVKQVSWDEKNQTGSFSGGANVIVKMAMHEMSGILDAIKRNTTLAQSMGVKYVYHDGESTASTIDFSPAFKKVKTVEGGVEKWVDTEEQKGFSLRVSKSEKANKDKKDSWSVGFTFAEAELLRLFFEDGLIHCFNALRNEEITRLQEYNESKKAKEIKVVKKTSTKKEEEKVPVTAENNSLEEPEDPKTTESDEWND